MKFQELTHECAERVISDIVGQCSCAKEIIEELTDDYDLPDVEIRKVLIEEITKAQLLKEEEAERRRLVEEKEKEMRERARLEKLEREKQARAAERERLRRRNSGRYRNNA